MAVRSFDALLDRMEASGIVRRPDLRGCSDTEIDALERRYHVKLPDSYRRYLVTMGHNSGRLLTHDHYAATFEHVLTLTEDCNEERGNAGHVVLPNDALVIVGRLAEQFLMIRCIDPVDSPVMYFNECDPDILEAFPTVLDWLNSLVDEAESAIDSGYYTSNPSGTRPVPTKR